MVEQLEEFVASIASHNQSLEEFSGKLVSLVSVSTECIDSVHVSNNKSVEYLWWVSRMGRKVEVKIELFLVHGSNNAVLFDSDRKVKEDCVEGRVFGGPSELAIVVEG